MAPVGVPESLTVILGITGRELRQHTIKPWVRGNGF
jgi:hypothetical protein